MALEIKWSNRADNSFDQIINYLHAEWGDQVVQAFVRKTYDFLDILAEFPEIGSLQVQDKGIRGFTLIKQVIVFYKVKENSIVILDFFDTRQNPEKKKLK
jgi:plasmid stabilization system protein ParE